MSEKMTYKPAKFIVGVAFEGELSFDKPLRSPSKNYPGKTNIWYGIKSLIDGTNGFNATENLDFIIQRLGLSAGDTIKIEKHQGDSFSFFSVNGKTKDDIEEGIVENQTTSWGGQAVVDEPKEMTDKEKLEILWKKHTEDIPF